MASSNLTYPAQDKDILIGLNVAVGLTCCLSIIGAITIIVSFVIFKELRTTSRCLLLNLSVADLIASAGNLVGAVTAYKFIGLEKTDLSSSVGILCKLEAFFGLWGTDASILWTIVLLAYLYVTLTCYRPSVLWNRIITVVCMILCWGIPLVVVIVFIVEGYFGFEPGFSPGFCTFVASNSSQIYRAIVGYEMFLWPSFVILPILCIVFICHSKCKMRKSLARNQYQYLTKHINAIKSAENKLIFVPIVYIIIRVWGLVTDITTFYLPEDVSMRYREMKISVFFLFMAGVGDSSQGFVNAIFFCLLTPAVRSRFVLIFSKLCSKYRCCRHPFSCCCGDRYSLLTRSSTNISSITVSYTSNSINYTEQNSDGSRARSMTDVSGDTSYYGSREEC